MKPLNRIVKIKLLEDGCGKITVCQIKEKFGGLRYYIDYQDNCSCPVVEAMISFAEKLSFKIK